MIKHYINTGTELFDYSLSDEVMQELVTFMFEEAKKQFDSEINMDIFGPKIRSSFLENACNVSYEYDLCLCLGGDSLGGGPSGADYLILKSETLFEDIIKKMLSEFVNAGYSYKEFNLFVWDSVCTALFAFYDFGDDND